jgi:hypothetical protein
MASASSEFDSAALEVLFHRYRFESTTDAINFALRAAARQPMKGTDILALQGSNIVAAVPDDLFI